MGDETPEETGAPGERAAAPSSQLAGLRARRQQVVDKLYTDLAVPRYDPAVFVRFSPIADHKVNAINKQAGKSKDPERDVVANAKALADVCVGVFEVIDGEEVSIDPDDRHGDWPKFDARLAELLGMSGDASNASTVVRGLYFTDGDIMSTAQKVAEWSGYSLNGVEEREGN